MYLSNGYIHRVCTGPQINNSSTKWIGKCIMITNTDGGSSFSKVQTVSATSSTLPFFLYIYNLSTYFSKQPTNPHNCSNYFWMPNIPKAQRVLPAEAKYENHASSTLVVFRPESSCSMHLRNWREILIPEEWTEIPVDVVS